MATRNSKSSRHRDSGFPRNLHTATVIGGFFCVKSIRLSRPDPVHIDGNFIFFCRRILAIYERPVEKRFSF
jgi:hypothetical protein